MAKAIQIEVGEWFCVGRIIQKNDHPNLPPYTSFRSNEDGTDAKGHASLKDAVNYCWNNPYLGPGRDLIDFGVAYKQPKVKSGIYMGVIWDYSEAYACYACDLNPDACFSSLRRVREYIKDAMENEEWQTEECHTCGYGMRNDDENGIYNCSNCECTNYHGE